MIPKIIHFVWFGEEKYSSITKDCMQSWKRHLTDYEFKLWNEKNSPMNMPFLYEAYKAKAWAFCSDYVRLWALFNEGGIYLDTDMLVLKNFDDILTYDFFIGKSDLDVIAGGIIGCKKENEFIRKCIDFLNNSHFDESFHLNNTIPKILTRIHNSMYFEAENHKVYDAEYFYPYTFEDSLKGINPQSKVTPNTIALHLWEASWFPDDYKGVLAAQNKRLLKALYYLTKAFIKQPKIIYISNMKYAISKYLKNN